MNKLHRRSTISMYLLLAVFTLQGPLYAKMQADIAETIGRENPFAGFEMSEPKPVDLTVVSTMPPGERPDLVMETIVLKFLDASNVAGLLSKMLTDYGAATANKANNSIVICDTPENMAKILAEIKGADRAPQQIVVEVVTLDVQLADSREIGVSWDLVSDNIGDVGYRQGFNEARLTSTIEDATTTGAATAFNTVGLGGDFSVVIGTVRHVLHMIQQTRETEILASPRALVVSGQTATIKAVEEVPYVEVTDTAAGGSGALTSTKFKEVGVTLQITATVADGNNIILNVEVEQNVRTGVSQSGVPTVDTRRATTSLFLRDGQTVVFAGLRRQEETKQVSKVPFLGDLPLLGQLFRSTSTVTNNSELVVLLSARIDESQTMPAVVLEKYEAFRDHSLLSARDPNEIAVDGALSPIGGLRRVGDMETGPLPPSE